MLRVPSACPERELLKLARADRSARRAQDRTHRRAAAERGAVPGILPGGPKCGVVWAGPRARSHRPVFRPSPLGGEGRSRR